MWTERPFSLVNKFKIGPNERKITSNDWRSATVIRPSETLSKTEVSSLSLSRQKWVRWQNHWIGRCKRHLPRKRCSSCSWRESPLAFCNQKRMFTRTQAGNASAGEKKLSKIMASSLFSPTHTSLWSNQKGVVIPIPFPSIGTNQEKPIDAKLRKFNTKKDE